MSEKVQQILTMVEGLPYNDIRSIITELENKLRTITPVPRISEEEYRMMRWRKGRNIVERSTPGNFHTNRSLWETSIGNYHRG